MEMISTLLDPSDWQSLKTNKEAMENFLVAFRAAAVMLNFIEQYYEYKAMMVRLALMKIPS